MRVGYVMNSYPMVSTTFIGREIQALEALGATAPRYAIRPWSDHDLVDPADRAEGARTRYLLTGSRGLLLRAFAAELATNPRGVARALALCWRLMRDAGGEVVRHAAYLIEAMALKRCAAADGVDHLHAHFASNATTVAMLSQALGGPPFSFTVHGPTDFFTPFSGSLALKVARARMVVCISLFCRSQVMLFSAQEDWPKLAVVHCGVMPADYDRPRCGGPGERLLFVGRLAGVKGAPVLLEAFAAVRAARPAATLTLVGDGPDRARLEAQAAALGVADAVVFAGYLSQDAVAARLAESDLFVLPSFAEGVPVVLMEALASRVPVVATRVAGVSELVEDGVSGLLAPPGDPVSLAAAIVALLADPERRRRMGEAGRAKVVAEFDAAREAAKLLALFRAAGTEDRA